VCPGAKLLSLESRHEVISTVVCQVEVCNEPNDPLGSDDLHQLVRVKHTKISNLARFGGESPSTWELILHKSGQGLMGLLACGESRLF
jgi:hypothetical protein